jgi:hypothetical protein
MLTLTALALLAATLPPLVQAQPEVAMPAAIQLSTPARKATLLEEEPSSAGALAGRAVMAPVLGMLGGGVTGGLGLIGGFVLGGSSWGGAALGILLGSVLAAVGFAVGVALGSALFSDDLGAMFKRSLGWALLGAAVGGVAFLVFALALPVIGLIVGVGAAIVTCAAVPFVVEARRLAVAAEQKERSALPVATF